MTRKTRQRRYTRLILFSGGIDSTYLLAQILRETEDPVIAHHVHLINREKRHNAEAKACKQIVEYCRANYRDFRFTESTVDRSNFRTMGYDVITVAAEGGIAASNYLLDTGQMPDFWMLGLNEEEAQALEDTKVTGSKTTTLQKPSQSRLNYLLAAMAASCYPNAPPKYLRPIIKPKRELMEYMGQDLVNLCWTCRRPIETNGEFTECGECITCKLMLSIKSQKAM